MAAELSTISVSVASLDCSMPENLPDDDRPDEWDQRIIDTGCHAENLALTLCHADTGDWRKCMAEMKAFRECWAANNNNERTRTVDNL